MTDFVVLDDYQHDIKKLEKRFPSIVEDVDLFLKALSAVLPEAVSGTVRISDLGISTDIPVYKVRHFRCKSLQGKGSRSGIRLIYGYIVTINEVTLIEIYHKSAQTNPTKKRIIAFLKSKQS